MPCPAIRPHFFGACPKKRCRAAKEKRLFYLGGSTIRVSATSRWSGRSSPDLWEGAGACLWVCTCAPIRWEVDCGPYCPFHPISLLLRKETGSNGRTVQRPPPKVTAHTYKAKSSGNPRRGFPLRPPPALYEAQGGSARCGGRPEALPLGSTAFEKAGETFIRARCAQRRAKTPRR